MANGESNLSPEAQDTLALLQRFFDDRPLTASEIVEALGIAAGWNWEARRREVRELVITLRQAGHRVCAYHAGYWLARDAAEWAEYLEHRKRGARFEFVTVRQMTEAATDRGNEQRQLFETAPPPDPEREREWATSR